MTEPQDPLRPIEAVRTVSEDDDVRVISGRAIPWGGPFNGKDTYQTFFSARSDLGLDHDVPLRILYNHGFDPDFRNSVIGRTATVRTEDDGVWVEAQINKRHRYYEERVKPLLDHPDGPQLGFSAGSAEHSYRTDPKSGEILEYPVAEFSLTPTEANPWAQIAARTAEVVTIIAARRDYDPDVGGGVDRDKLDPDDFAGPNRSFPIVEPQDVEDAAKAIGRAKGNKAQIRARIIEIAQRKGEAFAQKLPKEWSGAPEAERSGEVPPDDEDVVGEDAVRKGARNSNKDLTRINSIADHAAAILDHVAGLGGKANDELRQTAPAPQSPSLPADDASRSAEAPTVVTITQREDVAAIRAEALERAREVGRETAKRLTG